MEQPRPPYGYQEALERIRAEYLDMPGMRLTAEQLHRLSGVDLPICRQVFEDLVRARFLQRGPDGAYVRPASESSVA